MVGSKETRLVGRRGEVAALSAAAGRLGPPKSSFVALSGEPGIGKTRLLEELVRRAEDGGSLILSGRATELEHEMPFGLWIEVLDDHVAWLGADRLRRMLGDRVEELSRVLPSASAELGAAPALPDERFRAHQAVRALIERIAEPRPVVIVLDDLHWADGGSLELLVHLLSRPPRAPLLVTLAYRPGRLPPLVSRALQAAERDGLLVDMPLEPLSAADAAALLGTDVAEPLRDELYRLGGGNPLYMLQLARSKSMAAEVAAERAVAGVPPAVAAALGEEIEALSPPARLLAQGAAVVGDPVEPELAACAGDLGPATMTAALDELLEAGMLEATDVARRYRFRHPIVRSAVYADAGEGWRLAAHDRAASELARRRGSVAARAHHLERCAKFGDEAAIGLLVEAGQEAGSRAPAAAIRWFAAALRLMPGDLAQRLQLLVPLATAQATTGQLEPALDTLLEALELVPPELPELRVQLVAACASCENLLGRHRAAHDRLLRVLDDIPDKESAAAGSLRVELAADALYHVDYDAMAAYAEGAAATASELGDRGLTAVASALTCYARYAQGAMAAAETARANAAAIVDGLSDAELAGRLDAPYYLGFGEYFCERYDDAIRHLSRGIAVSRAAGRGQFVGPMMVGLAHALEVRGRLAEALDAAEGAVEAGRLAGNRHLASWALVAEGWISAMTGDLRRAGAAAEEAVALVEGLDESVVTLATHAHTAVIFLETGKPERCLEQARVAGAPEFARVEPARRAWLQAAMVPAELALGRRAGVQMWLRRAEQALEGIELPRAQSAVLYARAWAALDAGDNAGAADLAARAAEHADAVGASLDGSRARILAARAAARAGDRELAVATLTRAEGELTSYGAHRLRDEAAQELRRLGRRAAARQRRGATAAGPAALTGREREVADLVADGKTNRQIAAALYLSEKTIEGHVSNLFAKLGVSSRAAVAASIARQNPPI